MLPIPRECPGPAVSPTQFSPRLLRNFLRDRPNQVVLSTFVATFAYSAAGLYTVGLAAGSRTEDFPRLAVSGAIVLLFASLAMVVYFADHLAHSIQVDAIGKGVEKTTLAVVHGRLGDDEHSAPGPPAWTVPITAVQSGYLQTVHPERLLPLASRHHLHVRLRVRVGEHVVAGTTLGLRWHPTSGTPRTPISTPRSSITRWITRSGSGSKEPWSKTRHSAFGNSSTWPAKRYLRR